MKGWLKFYFLGFFNDRYGKEGATRSFLNALLGILIVFLALSGGITAGYSVSFATHYENAETFRSFLYENLSDGSLTVKDEKLSATFPGGERADVTDESSGYRLIVDTRPAATTFDDFKLVCKDKDKNTITYEQFRALSKDDQKKYNVALEYTGIWLDTAAKHPEYIAFLDKISTSGDAEYNEKTAAQYGDLKQKYTAGEIDEKEFNDGIYILYAKAYYPDYSGVEKFGKAPTLRTYYMLPDATGEKNRYFIALDDMCVCSFVTDGGITVDFGSYYGKVQNGGVTGGGITDAQARENIDGFIAQCFKSSGGFNFLVHLMNAGKFMLLFMLALFAIGLLTYILCKALRVEYGLNPFATVKIASGYALYASVITFVLSIILSFSLPRSTVFAAAEITVIAIIALRAFALFIAELIRERSAAKTAKREETAETEEREN